MNIVLRIINYLRNKLNMMEQYQNYLNEIARKPDGNQLVERHLMVACSQLGFKEKEKMRHCSTGSIVVRAEKAVLDETEAKPNHQVT